MPLNRDDPLQKEVFKQLKNLCVKFDAVYKKQRAIEAHMYECLEALDWQNDMELIREIVLYLPRGSVIRFKMYDRLFQLQEAAEDTPETALPQEGGDGDA